MKLLPLPLVLLLLAVVLHGATSTSDNDNDYNNNNVGVDMLDEGDILDEGFFDQEYFRDMSENDRRKLQDFPPYKTPKWWGRYKKMFGRKYIRRCNKWIIDHMEPPRSGSLYCPKFSGNYTCFFGEQKCEENGRRPQNHPDKQCTCVDKEWRCKDWSCPDPFFYTCPKTYKHLEKSNKKCLGKMKCKYNDDNKECECVNGEFVCTGGTSVAPKPAQDPAKDVVDTPDDSVISIDSFFPVPTPPAEQGQVCTVDGEELEIGEDCHCCGSCVPDWRCKCKGGKYACRKTFPPGMVCSCAAPPPPDVIVTQP